MKFITVSLCFSNRHSLLSSISISLKNAFPLKSISHFYYFKSNFHGSISMNYEYHDTKKLSPKILSELVTVSEYDDKISKILKEINEIHSKGNRYPNFLNSSQICELFNLESRSQRQKYLNYLYKKEKFKEIDKQKKVEKSKTKHILKTDLETKMECDTSKYGLGHNSLLLQVRKHSFHKFLNKRLANSILFGNKIVIDLDYDKYMIEKERKSCAGQLRHIISVNRTNCNPFDLYFCNANSTFKCVQYLKKDVPNIEHSLTSIYEESYLDIFPKENLVYLSPHAEEPLKIFDHNAIYIIGGFVDVVKKEKVSVEKAFSENIKSYSLPLDEYIQWKTGSKSLTINQVFEIMLTLKNTGDWKKAFGCIPSRKA